MAKTGECSEALRSMVKAVSYVLVTSTSDYFQQSYEAIVKMYRKNQKCDLAFDPI